MACGESHGAVNPWHFETKRNVVKDPCEVKPSALLQMYFQNLFAMHEPCKVTDDAAAHLVGNILVTMKG